MYGSMSGSFSDAELATKKRVSTNKVVFADTILHTLFNNPEYLQFANLVAQTSLAGKLNSRDAQFTIFVPIQLTDTIGRDKYIVEKFVKSHMYNSIIPSSLLKSSKTLQLKGNLNNMAVYSSSNSCSIQVNGANILQQETIGKSIIYLLDRPLFCSRGCAV